MTRAARAARGLLVIPPCPCWSTLDTIVSYHEPLVGQEKRIAGKSAPSASVNGGVLSRASGRFRAQADSVGIGGRARPADGIGAGLRAQDWPARPIKFIVSQAAGGTPDIICRLIAERLSRALGQQVVVDNQPGGGNIIGAQAAARAAPDGYTFFFATAAALVTNPYTFKSLPYDPAQGFRAGIDGRKQSVLPAGPSRPCRQRRCRS